MLEFNKDRPAWVSLYEAAAVLPYGQVIPYTELKQMTGLDINKSDRGVVYSANKRLCGEPKRLLINIRGVGYKVGMPDEHMAHGINRRKRAGRQYRRGVIELKGVKIDDLSPDEKVRHQHFINHMMCELKSAYATAWAAHKKHQQAGEKHREADAKSAEALSKIETMMGELADLKSKLK